MRKIVFINPPLTLKERYGKLSFAGSTLPSLGLCWLAAVARKNGCFVRIIEASSLNLTQEETLDIVFKDSPKYVAITATSCSIIGASQIANAIKAIDNKIKIIIGGPHLSAIPMETMERFTCFDIGVIGEGEETLDEILISNAEPEALAGIKSIIYRCNEELHLTEKRPFIKELDELPFPAWDLLDGFPKKYRPVATRFRRLPAASLVTTRGCPNRCVFCDRSIFESVCRSFTPEYTFEMIKTLYYKYGVQEILFEDDTFFVFKKNIEDICNMILKYDLDISWSCLGRVNNVDAELLKLMEKAGCWQIGYGIESGSQEILDLMRKNITLEQIRNAVYLTKRAGIQAKGFFMLGFPSETHKTIRKTMDFTKELDLDDMTITQFTPLPGSEIYRTIKRYGEFDDDWEKMNLLESVFIPEGLTKKDIVNYSKHMASEFYLRPRTIFNYIGRLLNLFRIMVLDKTIKMRL